MFIFRHPWPATSPDCSSGGLDFEEFTALLKDMHADEAVAKKRMMTYDLPASLLKEFSKVYTIYIALYTEYSSLYER